MEIPIINRMSNFDDPSVLSRLFPISQISQPFSLWKWGALILALLATFTSIINRTKILIIRLRKRSSLAAQPLHSEPDDGGFSDSEDDTCSSISSDDDDDAEPMSLIEDDKNVRVGYCEDEPQSHKTKLRICRSIGDRLFLSELTNGKSIVKLWDGLSLDNSCGSLVSIYDLNKDLNKSSFFGGTHRFPSVSVTSPAVVVSTMTGNAMNTALRVWDTRVGRQIPAIFAEWRPQMGKRVSISTGGIEKVYVRDDVTGELTVGDMRNASSPLQNVTECDGGTWWDADAVMVYKDYVDQWAVKGCESIVSRCCDAVKSYLF